MIVPIYSKRYLAKTISEVQASIYARKTVKIRGWVAKKRALKGKIFLLIRDSTGVIQCVIASGDKSWAEATAITTESSCMIKGKIVRDPRAQGGYELQVSTLEIVGLAETWPIARDTSPEFLRGIRHLSIRQQKSQAIMKIRSGVIGGFHEYFRGRGYHEHQSPSFTPAPGESGAETFEVKYFGKKAYLTQTWQLYAEMMIPVLEKIYTVAPSFRSDKSMTSRHLTEFWHAEVETAWQEFPELLETMEGVVRFICKKIAKEFRAELTLLGKDWKYFATLPKFPRITYREAIVELRKSGFKTKFGDDLGTKEEKFLVDKRKLPLFITHYPTKLKAFYMKRDPEDHEQVLASDLMIPGIGELIGSSERSLDFEDVKKRLKLAKEDPKKYEFYFDLSKYGKVPHSGFGLGIERLVMWLTGADSVKECIAFPRTPTRFTP